jgi:hypothetical protein
LITLEIILAVLEDSCFDTEYEKKIVGINGRSSNMQNKPN